MELMHMVSEISDIAANFTTAILNVSTILVLIRDYVNKAKPTGK